MKTVYEIAWDLLKQHPYDHDSARLIGAGNITGIDRKILERMMTKLKLLRKGRGIDDDLQGYFALIEELKDKISLVEDIIGEIKQGKAHYPVEESK